MQCFFSGRCFCWSKFGIKLRKKSADDNYRLHSNGMWLKCWSDFNAMNCFFLKWMKPKWFPFFSWQIRTSQKKTHSERHVANMKSPLQIQMFHVINKHFRGLNIAIVKFELVFPHLYVLAAVQSHTKRVTETKKSNKRWYLAYECNSAKKCNKSAQCLRICRAKHSQTLTLLSWKLLHSIDHTNRNAFRFANGQSLNNIANGTHDDLCCYWNIQCIEWECWKIASVFPFIPQDIRVEWA